MAEPIALTVSIDAQAAASIPKVTSGRRLLVVSYHFPPDQAIGGMRWAGLTKYLASDRWLSWVVTGAAPASQSVAGVIVASHPRARTLNDAYRRWSARRALSRASLASTRTSAPGSGEQQDQTEKWLARLRREGGSLLGLPDEARGWLLRATLATHRLITQVHPSVVVSSGPPHSAHLVAWLATRLRRIRWIADLRDPWAGPFSAGWGETSMSRSNVSRWLTTRLERIALPSASMIICNTREFGAVLQARYPNVSVEFIPNAVDRALLPTITASPFPGLGIIHVGTIYGGRNLGPVLVALRALFDRHPAAVDDGTCLRIAGNTDEPYARAVRRQIAELRLERQVEFLGVLPREDALQLVGRSRLAIVLAQHQDLQVPAKLYEMVAMGAPTVVLTALDSAAASEASRLGATAVDPDDIEGLVQLMTRARDRTRPITPVNAGEADYQQLAVRVGTLLAKP